ncbi:MAG: FAD-dependent oxidoreductase [Bacteroidetes bacterium]|nr:FAD-dependent oxidoreductase [Bacteroidota bacterium]
MTYDAIIIGAGLGGLIAGAKLAKGGKKVLLIEQHSVPGGCATSFKRGDFIMEVGLHEMDGLHKKDLKTRIFRDLGVFDKVDFLKLPDFYRLKKGQLDIVVSHVPEEAKETLLKHFPDEEKAIDAYFNQIFDETIGNFYDSDEVGASVGQFMDSITDNEDLKFVLLGNLGYYHDDPYALSLDYYSVAQRSYYTGGGNFIKGSSQRLSDYLSDYIKDNGGEVIMRHSVTEIIVENEKAVGVTYVGKKKGSEPKKAFATDIIANAAMQNVAEMLPEKYGSELTNQIKDHDIAASLLTLYLGFNKPLQDLGFKNYATFIFGDEMKTQADIVKNSKSDYSTRSFTFIDYGQVDSELAPKGKSVGAVCCVDYTSEWEGLSRNEYLAKKEEVSKTFIKRLEKLIPGLTDAVEYYELGTATTVKRYILTPKGSVYGFAQTPEKIIAEDIKSIENLHFASAWAKLGGGYSGAIYNGYMCGIGILRNRR